jgi:prespore-specific regulator
MKVRQDAWTEEDDLLLAETVLRHVREGSTQLNAFEEVGDKLNRTSAACGFRWNAVVRYTYDQALQMAKKHRKERMRAASGEQAKKRLLYNPPVPAFTAPIDEDIESFEETVPAMQRYSGGQLTMSDVIEFLQTVGGSGAKAEALQRENERLKREAAELNRQNQELAHKINQMEQQSTTIQEDYETILKIMNRARQIALIEDEERSATSFRMDRNGNLEKIAE